MAAKRWDLQSINCKLRWIFDTHGNGFPAVRFANVER